MGKKIDLGRTAAEAGKTAAAIFDRARSAVVKAVDQNGDGELNMEDAAVIAETIGSTAKSAFASVRESVENRNREMERQTLRPIFREDLERADFLMPKLVRITEMDKRRAESEVCRGSIGYMSVQADLPVVHVFRNQVSAFGLIFYPSTDSEVYYVDPSDRNRYIALDDYFSYLKTARINELQKIAQDLGAKHFRVTYKEEKVVFSSQKTKGKISTGVKAIGGTASLDGGQEWSSSEMAKVEIAAEMSCPGHEPLEPDLVYLLHEQSVHSLIALRMDSLSPISRQKFSLRLSNSSGMKEQEAVKIDAALKAMKFTGNASIAGEARNEMRRILEYEIEF